MQRDTKGIERNEAICELTNERKEDAGYGDYIDA